MGRNSRVGLQGDTGKLIWKEDPGAGAGEEPGRGGNLTIAESTKQMNTKRKEEASEMARDNTCLFMTWLLEVSAFL